MPVIDDCNAIGHGQCFFLIMRHINCGHCETVVQSAQFDLHLLAKFFIECRKRFVHEKDFRLEYNGPRQRDSLALTP